MEGEWREGGKKQEREKQERWRKGKTISVGFKNAVVSVYFISMIKLSKGRKNLIVRSLILLYVTEIRD